MTPAGDRARLADAVLQVRDYMARRRITRNDLVDSNLEDMDESKFSAVIRVWQLIDELNVGIDDLENCDCS